MEMEGTILSKVSQKGKINIGMFHLHAKTPNRGSGKKQQNSQANHRFEAFSRGRGGKGAKTGQEKTQGQW